MFKKIKLFIMSILVASMLPVFRIDNPEPAVNDPEPPTGDQKADAENSEKDIERIAELEKTVTEANSKAAGLAESLNKSNEQISQLNGSLKLAMESYKTLLISANPGVLPELITGESIEALDGSLMKARELIGKVKSHLEVQARQTRIPAGAPPRGRETVESLSAREKIREGIGRR